MSIVLKSHEVQVSVDTIPWGLLKELLEKVTGLELVSVDTIPWGLLKVYSTI